MVTQDARQATAPPVTAPGPMQVLLIEDDDADALLVEELLLDVAAAVTLRRARSMTEAKPLLSSATCVLLDLGLPDTPELQQLEGGRWLLRYAAWSADHEGQTPAAQAAYCQAQYIVGEAVAAATRSAIAMGGAHALFTMAPLERLFRDVHAMSTHMLLQPDAIGEVYGRLLLDLPLPPTARV